MRQVLLTIRSEVRWWDDNGVGFDAIPATAHTERFPNEADASTLAHLYGRIVLPGHLSPDHREQAAVIEARGLWHDLSPYLDKLKDRATQVMSVAASR